MRQAGFSILLSFAAAAVWCQSGPGTSELRVNTSRADRLKDPAVAQNAAGEFVVAWRGEGFYSGYSSYYYPDGVFAQRFDSAGRKLGGELQVNTAPQGEYAYGPGVAIDGAGRFLVVWSDEYQIATYARRYDSDGEPLGDPEKIGAVGPPAVAGDETGNALAVWSHFVSRSHAVSGRIFDAASGTWQEPFTIHQSEQRIVPARVAADASGGFVVVWGRGEDVLARRFTSAGEPREGELVLNQEPAAWIDVADRVSVGAGGDGGFVVAWNRWEGGPRSVRVRRFDASGAPWGDEVVLRSDDRFPATPVVAVDAAGEHLVAWPRWSEGEDGPLLGHERYRRELAGRWFDAAGNARGGVFPLVYGGRASIDSLDLAMTPAGRLAVAFVALGDIYARLLPPAARGGVLQLAEEPGGVPWSALVEEEMTIPVEVVRTGGVTGEVSVEHFAAGGSATPGEDFTSDPGRLVFAEGEYLKSFPLTVHEDEVAEGDEQLTVGLRDPDGALLREPAAFAVTLYDDESTLPGEGPYPRGEKLRTNDAAGVHRRPRVALRPDGSFLVVWGSGEGPRNEWSVHGRLYDAAGQADGEELVISEEPRLSWPGPAVAATPGGFLVTWTARLRIRGRRITPGRGPGPVLDLGSCGSQCTGPAGTEVTAGDDGRFVVFWGYDYDPGIQNFSETYFEGQLFDQDATPVGERISRNGSVFFPLSEPSRLELALSSLRDDGFLVVWNDGACNLRSELFGAASSGESHSLGRHCSPAPTLVRPGGDGFLFFNQDLAPDPPGGVFGGLSNAAGVEISGRRLDAGGAPAGAPFGVNGFSPDSQADPRAAASPSGEHVVVWASDGEPGPGRRSIVARRYDAEGRRIGRRFAVRPSNRLQSAPDVAMAAGGDFVVVWEEDAGDGASDVYAQPYVGSSCTPTGRALCLNQGRFELTVTWRDFKGKTGDGRAVPLTDDTGAFYFFGPENLELMVKVLDGRHLTGHYWVFYGSLSNVEFTLTVTDTSNGKSKRYVNPLGQFASVGDVRALPGD